MALFNLTFFLSGTLSHLIFFVRKVLGNPHHLVPTLSFHFILKSHFAHSRYFFSYSLAFFLMILSFQASAYPVDNDDEYIEYQPYSRNGKPNQKHRSPSYYHVPSPQAPPESEYYPPDNDDDYQEYYRMPSESSSRQPRREPPLDNDVDYQPPKSSHIDEEMGFYPLHFD